MARGLPRSYIIRARRELPKGASISRIFKKAWRLYKKSKVYKPLTKKLRSRRRTPSRRKNPKKVRKLARRRYRRRKRQSRKFTIPIAVVAGVAAGSAPPIIHAIQSRDFRMSIRMLVENYTGIDIDTGKFYWEGLSRGLLPLIMGVAIHKVAGVLGINRALGRAKIPILRI